MKTREDIITSMCYTWRHDYGLVKETSTFPFEAGMTQGQREILWKQMAQIFDNDIAPYMEFKQ
jgi:hypothetical protein